MDNYIETLYLKLHSALYTITNKHIKYNDFKYDISHITWIMSNRNDKKNKYIIEEYDNILNDDKIFIKYYNMYVDEYSKTSTLYVSMISFFSYEIYEYKKNIEKELRLQKIKQLMLL